MVERRHDIASTLFAKSPWTQHHKGCTSLLLRRLTSRLRHPEFIDFNDPNLALTSRSNLRTTWAVDHPTREPAQLPDNKFGNPSSGNSARSVNAGTIVSHGFDEQVAGEIVTLRRERPTLVGR